MSGAREWCKLILNIKRQVMKENGSNTLDALSSSGEAKIIYEEKAESPMKANLSPENKVVSPVKAPISPEKINVPSTTVVDAHNPEAIAVANAEVVPPSVISISDPKDADKAVQVGPGAPKQDYSKLKERAKTAGLVILGLGIIALLLSPAGPLAFVGLAIFGGLTVAGMAIAGAGVTSGAAISSAGVVSGNAIAGVSTTAAYATAGAFNTTAGIAGGSAAAGVVGGVGAAYLINENNKKKDNNTTAVIAGGAAAAGVGAAYLINENNKNKDKTKENQVKEKPVKRSWFDFANSKSSQSKA